MPSPALCIPRGTDLCHCLMAIALISLDPVAFAVEVKLEGSTDPHRQGWGYGCYPVCLRLAEGVALGKV